MEARDLARLAGIDAANLSRIENDNSTIIPYRICFSFIFARNFNLEIVYVNHE